MDSGELIVRAIGEFGRWQFLVTLLILASKFAVCWHQVLMVITSPPANFTCSDPTIGKCDANCSEHVFDRSVFTETIITEWDLVCDRSWLASLTQTFVMLGILVGNIGFGYLSDKFGRRRPLVFAIILQVVSGVAAAFTPYFWLYITLRFFSTVATGGTMLATFVLLMEFTAKKYRTIMGILFHVPYNIGQMLLGLIGYLLRDWHHIQMTVSIPQILLISYWCILPESPRWLLTVGKTEEAIQMLEQAAQCNKRPIEHIRSEVEDYVRGSRDQKIVLGNVFDLIRTKRMRIKTISFCMNWFGISLGFFGITQFMGAIDGNIFVNIVISGIMQIPGGLIAIIILDRFGRKYSLILAYSICFVASFIIVFIPNDLTWLISTMGCIVTMGAAMSFSMIYVYTSETYPTVIRNIGIGVASVAARLGSMIAPFVMQSNELETWLPPLIFSIFPVINLIITLMILPETNNVKMPDTIEEADAL